MENGGVMMGFFDMFFKKKKKNKYFICKNCRKKTMTRLEHMHGVSENLNVLVPKYTCDKK